MSVLSIARNFNEKPQIVNMEVNVTLATIAAVGWLALPAVIADIENLNSGLWVWQDGDMVLAQASDGDAFFTVNLTTNSLVLYSTAGNGAVTLPVVSNDFVNFDGTLGALKDSGYSPSDASKTKVVMAGSAVQVGYIAHFVDTSGTIDDTAANIQNDGNIQAGKSGTAGSLISFPSVAAEGSLILAAVSNASGNFNTTISNASAIGQSQVISIPDAGSATANFIISKSAGTQHITTGSLAVDVGNMTAGSSGNAGSHISFPPTAANGTLILAAANAGGAFNTTISNGAMSQSTVYTIGDIGAATGAIPVSTGAARLKFVAAAVVAGGSAANTITDAFATTGSVIIGNWVTQTNPAQVIKIAPANGSFVVTSTADPGSSTFSYFIMK